MKKTESQMKPAKSSAELFVCQQAATEWVRTKTKDSAAAAAPLFDIITESLEV